MSKYYEWSKKKLWRMRHKEKEIQGGMVGKEERGAEARCWRSQTSDPRRPALKALPNLSLNVSDTLRATRAKWSGTTCHYLEP